MEQTCSEHTTELAKALIKVQQKLQPATKDSENPFCKSKYASLNSVINSCRDALLENGIWLTQYPIPVDNGYFGLVTKLTHAETEQYQSCLAVVPLPKNDPQGLGIAMTYLRRYSLSALLGIVTEEDTDGEFEKYPFANGSSSNSYTKKNQDKKRVVPSSDSKNQPVYQEEVPDNPQVNLPVIDGVSYQRYEAEEGQPYYVATGNVYPKREMLSAAGFRWDAKQKCWWRYE